MAKYDEFGLKVTLITTTVEDNHGFGQDHSEVLLPGDVILKLRCDYESNDNFQCTNDFSLNVEEAASMVSDHVRACHTMGFEKIAGIFYQAQQLFAKWQEEYNSEIRLLDACISVNEWWRHTSQLPTFINYLCIDEFLCPSMKSIDIYDLDSLFDELHEEFKKYCQRKLAKEGFSRQGAEGEIDLLALKFLEWSVANDPNASKVKRGIVCNNLGFRVSSGHIYLNCFISHKPKIYVNGDQIKIYEIELPELTLQNSVGLPITDLVEYPLLSPEISVVEARNDPHGVEFVISQPKYLFIWSSGGYPTPLKIS